MNPRALLVVDDKSSASDKIVKALKLAIKGSVIETVRRPEPVLGLVEKKHFDIVLVDLHLTDEDDSLPEDRWSYEGIQLIASLVPVTQSTLLVAYSSSFGYGKAEDNVIGRAARKAGADMVISRTEIDSFAPETLMNNLVNAFQRKCGESGKNRNFEMSDDLATRAACELVGEDNLRDLVVQAMSGVTVEHVNALVGGLSGSVVLAVKSKPTAAETDVAYCVVKVDTHKRIDYEFAAQPEVGTHFGRMSARIAPNKTKEIHGWKAIRMEFIGGSNSLRTILAPTDSNVEDLEKILDRLACWATESCSSVPGASLQRWDVDVLRLSAMDLLRVQTNLTYMSSAENVLSELEVRAAADLLNVLNIIEDIDFASASVLQVPQHGDLNCENVFLSANAGPVFIDLPHQKRYPRFYDLAQIMIDAFAISLHSVGGNKYLLDKQSSVLECFKASILGVNENEKEGASTREPTELFIRKMSEVVSTEVDLHGDEWKRLIAYHCMRFLRYSDLPLGRKAILAVVARDILVPALEIEQA